MKDSSEAPIAMRSLRLLLLVDAAVLCGLGLALILAPHKALEAFHFPNLPTGVHYIVSLWGCAILTMSAGYFMAAIEPLRHIIWIQVGIARGAIELIVGAVYLARGVITFQQAGFGLIAAALVTIGYVALYPRKVETPEVVFLPANPTKP
jgi:hypothetical protein